MEQAETRSMGIEDKLNRVALLLEKFLLVQEFSPNKTNKAEPMVDKNTIDLMREFTEGIKSLKYLNECIKKNQSPRYMRLREVVKIVGLSKSTIGRLIKRNEFPEGRYLGGNSQAWLSTEIDEWMFSREKMR